MYYDWSLGCMLVVWLSLDCLLIAVWLLIVVPDSCKTISVRNQKLTETIIPVLCLLLGGNTWQIQVNSKTSYLILKGHEAKKNMKCPLLQHFFLSGYMRLGKNL